MEFKKTKEILNQLVADLSQFSVVARQTHWYMYGSEFLTLHPQMGEYMGQINEQLDVVSERLITLDGSPLSTSCGFAEDTKIEDGIGSWDRTIPERMERLVAGYRYLADPCAKGIGVSGEGDDNYTQDTFIANKTDIEKDIWMLQVKLGKAPGIDT